MTAYYSYKYSLMPSPFVKPIALKHPYSQIFSWIFCVVEIKSKKNARERAIAPTIPTKIWKKVRAWTISPLVDYRSSKIVVSSLK